MRQSIETNALIPFWGSGGGVVGNSCIEHMNLSEWIRHTKAPLRLFVYSTKIVQFFFIFNFRRRTLMCHLFSSDSYYSLCMCMVHICVVWYVVCELVYEMCVTCFEFMFFCLLLYRDTEWNSNVIFFLCFREEYNF